MRRRDKPEPEPAGRAKIRELILQVVAAHARDGRTSHRDSANYSPAAEELMVLDPVGMGSYALARRLSDPTPITPAELDALAARFDRRPHD